MLGCAAVVDLSLPVSGRFILVDHALTRMERGLVGALIVEGPVAPGIFRAELDAALTSTSAKPPAAAPAAATGVPGARD